MSKNNQYESNFIPTLTDMKSTVNSFIDPNHKNYRLPFSVFMNIPKGFQLRKQEPKLVYDVSYLSMTKETCKKSIEVENCGLVEVDLYALKIKGCIPFLLNVFIEPIHTQYIYSSSNKDTSISLCYQETVSIEHVLKYSVSTLPYYAIDGEHIQVRHLEVLPVDTDCTTIKISGIFFFEYE
ncbi:hypothetical protein ACP3VS_18445 [Lysinibacillus sp. VIII_CA]|uniref:hypothetical protein n=1 Tax=Lysinibacillus sp. VIII_CA TaxID=3417452 RepID=UPI003CEC8750